MISEVVNFSWNILKWGLVVAWGEVEERPGVEQWGQGDGRRWQEKPTVFGARVKWASLNSKISEDWDRRVLVREMVKSVWKLDREAKYFYTKLSIHFYVFVVKVYREFLESHQNYFLNNLVTKKCFSYSMMLHYIFVSLINSTDVHTLWCI